MIKVGITGGIGSGKTTVCKIFEVLGVPVYYADDRAKWLMKNNQKLKSEITSEFGNKSYDESGELNRVYLAQEVFSSKENSDIINGLVHPAVGEDFNRWVSSHNTPYVLKEAALLFESGSYRAMDKIITVTCPTDIRIERVLKRDPQRSKQDVINILDKQWDELSKVNKSDIIIKNFADHLLIPQAIKVHTSLNL